MSSSAKDQHSRVLFYSRSQLAALFVENFEFSEMEWEGVFIALSAFG